MHDKSTQGQVREALLKYLDTDTIWYAPVYFLRNANQFFLPCSFHQRYPNALVQLQRTHWDPILDWAQKTLKIEIKTFRSIFSTPQPSKTLAKLDYVMSTFDPWQMAGMVTPSSPLKPC